MLKHWLRTYGHIGTPRSIFFLFWLLCSGGHKTSKNEIKNGGSRLRLGATCLNTNGRFRTYSIIVVDLLMDDRLPFIIWNNWNRKETEKFGFPFCQLYPQCFWYRGGSGVLPSKMGIILKDALDYFFIVFILCNVIHIISESGIKKWGSSSQFGQNWGVVHIEIGSNIPIL